MEERIRATAAVLPCYGLAGWVGLRMIGDWEWENDELVTVGRTHGTPESDGPTPHVHTTIRDPAADVASLRMAAAGPPRDEDDTHSVAAASSMSWLGSRRRSPWMPLQSRSQFGAAASDGGRPDTTTGLASCWRASGFA